jgi:hypothetical protein
VKPAIRRFRKFRGDEENDKLTGESGADVFFFDVDDGTDIVTDFKIGIDSLNVLSFGRTDVTLTSSGNSTNIYVEDTLVAELRNVDATSLTIDDLFL